MSISTLDTLARTFQKELINQSNEQSFDKEILTCLWTRFRSEILIHGGDISPKNAKRMAQVALDSRDIIVLKHLKEKGLYLKSIFGEQVETICKSSNASWELIEVLLDKRSGTPQDQGEK